MVAVGNRDGRQARRLGMVRPALAMLACLVLLPSCVTTMLWQDDGGPGRRRQPRTYPELLGEDAQSVAGDLAFGGDGRAGEAWMCDQQGRANWSVLAPHGGDAAAVVLAGRCGAVEHVTVLGSRSFVDADLTMSTAEVRVETRFEPERIGRAVTWREVGDAAADVLSVERRNAFAFAADPWLRFPRVYRECVQRLDTVDLGRLVGGSGGQSCDVLAFVLVDDEGLPCFEPGSTRRAAPPLADRQVTFDERLELLGQVQLLVRARIGGEERLLQLDPEQLWLWSSAERSGRRLVHTGRWTLFPADPDEPPGDGSRRVAYVADIRTRRFELVETVPPIDAGSDFWNKLAWTPVTLAIDILTLPIQAFVLGGDDEDDRPARRPRR